MVCYSCNINTTTAKVSTTSQASHGHRFWCPWMGEIEDYVSLLGSVHSIFQYCEHQTVGRNLSGAYQLGFSMFCDSRIRCLQEQGLAIKFDTGSKNIGNSL